MTLAHYLRPIALCDSPQSEDGEALRLAGGLVYASRFALIVRDGSTIVSRRRVSVAEIASALAELPDPVKTDAEAQWSALRAVHAPLQCGPRTRDPAGDSLK